MTGPTDVDTPSSFAALTRRYAEALSRPRDVATAEVTRRKVAQLCEPLLGTWTCSGVTQDPFTQLPRRIEASLRCAYTLDGLWVCAEYAEGPTADAAQGSPAIDFWGYDPWRGGFVRFGFGGQETGFFGRSAGASEGQLVWSGVWVGGRTTIPSRDLISWGEDSLRVIGELQIDNERRVVATLEGRRLAGATP